MSNESKIHNDEKGYIVNANGSQKPFMILKIELDKINKESIRIDSNGNRFIEILVNQSRKKEGSIYLTQTLSAEVIRKSKSLINNIIGFGHKHISLNYYIQKYYDDEFLDYLFYELEDPDV